MKSLLSKALSASLLVFSFPLISTAAANTCSASYVVDEVKGEEQIEVDGANLQAVNIFSFQFNGQCEIETKSPWVEEVSVKLRNDPNRMILVDIVNEIKLTPGPCRNLSTGQILHRIFSDPVKRADHIKRLVALSALGQGLEIDYEQVLATSTVLLTQFMGELRAALPPGKRLGMVVQPKTQGGGEQGKTVDWRGVEPHVDYLRVMAYYYSWSSSVPGPVITYAKLSQLGDYILNNPTQSIPRSKARILLSMYGWDWPLTPGGRGKLIRFEDAMAIAQAEGVTPDRDPVQDTLKFQYVDDSGVTHEVWVDDALSLQKRIQLLLDMDFPAIDLWHLKTGDHALWDWFKPRIRADCPKLAVPVLPPAAAVINDITPNAAALPGGQTTLTISGSNFTPADVVLFAGNPYVPANVTPTSMDVVIPAFNLEKPGVRRVAVTQNARLSNTANFYIVGNPQIASFDPPGAVQNTAFDFTLHGDGFEPSSFIRWNGRDLPTQFIDTTELRTTVPPDLVPIAATFLVGVVNPTSGARLSRNFTVTAAPPQPGQPGGQPPSGAPAPGEFAVGPNPWTRDQTGGVRFNGVADDDIEIFAVSGHRVRRLRANGGSAEWDLKNDDGENVASGFYFYHAPALNGGRTKGTLVVVR